VWTTVTAHWEHHGNTHLPAALLGGKLKVVELSIDQKPERADERKRIQKAGGRCEALMDETGESGTLQLCATSQAHRATYNNRLSDESGAQTNVFSPYFLLNATDARYNDTRHRFHSWLFLSRQCHTAPPCPCRFLLRLVAASRSHAAPPAAASLPKHASAPATVPEQPTRFVRHVMLHRT
jgi:hypothetical protein